MRSNFSFALVGLILISGTCGLHLHLQAVQYVDNLDQSNENYYFGTIDKASYFAAQSSFRQAHPEAQSCPPSLSYVNTSNSNQSCFACDKIQQGIDLNTAKVLFNIQTRQCETCATGKTTICDKLLAGTFFSSTSPTASTAPASSSSSTTSSTTKSSTTPSSTTSVTNNPATTNNTSNTTSSQNTTTNAASASGATTNTASTQSSTSSQSSSSTTDAVLSNNCPPERPLYNENTKLCDSCRAGFEFLGTKQQCVPIIYATDPNAKGILLTNLTQLIDLNKQIQKKHPEQVIQFCPPDRPYAQNNRCIQCSGNDQFFYVTTNACVTGCPSGTYYDSRVMQCAPALFYSDVNAPWLVSQLGSYDAWKAKVEYQASSSPRMTRCPNFKPYEKNGKCISCEGGKYFDIDKGECVGCSRGRRYSASQRRCIGIVNYDHSMKTFASAVI